MTLKNKERLSQEDIKARLMFLIGSVLSFVFLVVTLGITYALIFVTQPIGGQAPNDAAFIDLLKTLAIFLTGSLGGVLASNGLKDKQQKSEYEKAIEKRFDSSDTPQSRRDS